MSSWHCSSHAVRPRVGIKAVIIWPKLAQKQSWVGLMPVILRPIKVGIEAVMSWQNECFPNLGPLHLLDNFVKEILASDSSQSYLRKEQAKKRKGDLSPMTWTRVLLWEPLKKGFKKSCVFRHRFGKILLNKNI